MQGTLRIEGSSIRYVVNSLLYTVLQALPSQRSRRVAPDIAAGWLLVLVQDMRPALIATAAGERAQDLNRATKMGSARQALDAPPEACSEARTEHATTQARVELEDRGQLRCVWLPMELEVHAPNASELRVVHDASQRGN